MCVSYKTGSLKIVIFFFSLVRGKKLKFEGQEVVRECNMKSLCDIGVCYIVVKLFKRSSLYLQTFNNKISVGLSST